MKPARYVSPYPEAEGESGGIPLKDGLLESSPEAHAIVFSVCPNATLLKDADTVTGGAACAAAGFTSGTPNTRNVSPVPGVLARTAPLVGAIETTRLPTPEDLVHCDESVGTADPDGPWTPVRVIDPDVVTLPVSPLTVMAGEQPAKSGTLKVKLTAIVLLSQGYGDDWVMPHFQAPIEPGLNAATRINIALPSAGEASAVLDVVHTDVPSLPWYPIVVAACVNRPLLTEIVGAAWP